MRKFLAPSIRVSDLEQGVAYFNVSSIRQSQTLDRLSFVSRPFLCVFVSIPETPAKIVVENRAGLGTIKGIVRDEAGKPIADAMVAVYRVGTSKLLKQVRSAADGSFLAKILPGTYTVLAVAQGFNPITLATVEVSRSAELVYGFKLERSGSGNTLPEKRADRTSPKWVIRAAQNRRRVIKIRKTRNKLTKTRQPK